MSEDEKGTRQLDRLTCPGCAHLADYCTCDATPDDTAAPSHYTANHAAEGIEQGAELISWIVAMRGKQFAIDAMIFEIQTKANRLGLGARADHIVEDCFKIRQACRVVERLEGEK